jgi:hypothetical protein
VFHPGRRPTLLPWTGAGSRRRGVREAGVGMRGWFPLRRNSLQALQDENSNSVRTDPFSCSRGSCGLGLMVGIAALCPFSASRAVVERRQQDSVIAPRPVGLPAKPHGCADTYLFESRVHRAVREFLLGLVLGGRRWRGVRFTNGWSSARNHGTTSFIVPVGEPWRSICTYSRFIASMVYDHSAGAGGSSRALPGGGGRCWYE